MIVLVHCVDINRHICVAMVFVLYLEMAFVCCMDINSHICVAMVFVLLCIDGICVFCRYK